MRPESILDWASAPGCGRLARKCVREGQNGHFGASRTIRKRSSGRLDGVPAAIGDRPPPDSRACPAKRGGTTPIPEEWGAV